MATSSTSSSSSSSSSFNTMHQMTHTTLFEPHLSWPDVDLRSAYGNMFLTTAYVKPYALLTKPKESLTTWWNYFQPNTEQAKENLERCSGGYAHILAIYMLLTIISLDQYGGGHLQTAGRDRRGQECHSWSVTKVDCGIDCCKVAATLHLINQWAISSAANSGFRCNQVSNMVKIQAYV